MNSKLMCFLLFGSLLQSNAIDVTNFSATTNNRFADDPSFVGAGYDWSGVGRTSNGRWGTLLGDNYFITANHFEPNVGQNVTFVSGNNLSSSAFSYPVAGRLPIAGTDLVISYFSSTVDSSIARYGFSTTPADALGDLGLSGVDLFASGDRVSGASGTIFDHVVGLNQAESWFEGGTNIVATPETTVTVGGPGFDQIVTFQNIAGDTANTTTAYEAQLQSGDSGSPLFSVSGGELFVQGIGYAVVADPDFLAGNFIDTGGPSPSPDPYELREATFYSYLGSYGTELNLAIAGVPTVPEPSVALLLLLSPLLLKRRR